MADTKATLNEISSKGLPIKLVSNGDDPETFSLAVATSGGAAPSTVTANQGTAHASALWGVQGQAADGAAIPAGKPVLVAGQDGTNVQTLKTNSDGELLVNLESGDIQIGAVEIKNATTDDRASVSAAGAVKTEGGAADGTAVAGNPHLMAGSDGTNAQTLSTNASGEQDVVQKTKNEASADALGTNPVVDADRNGVLVQHIVRPLVYNGTNFDRLRGTTAGLKTTSRAISGQLIDPADGTTALTVKTANGVATASGDNVVLAAVASKKIRVLSYGLQVQEAGTLVTARFQDNGTATNRTMPWQLFRSTDNTVIQGVVRNPGGGEHFYFETGDGVGLDLNLDGAIDVGWEITYIEVE